MKRIITALLLAPAIVAVVLWARCGCSMRWVAAVAAICYREYAGIAAAYGFGELGPLGYGAGLLVLTFPYEAFPAALLLLLLALTLAMRAADLRNALPRAALLFAGVLYCFGTFRFAIPLRAANRTG